jgi:hypothetical protein
MPPRKPKQPAKRKAAKKSTPKKAQPKAQSKAVTPSGEEYNPQTHILCDDGKVYERKIVSGTGISVGVNATQRTDVHVELEGKIVAAIHQAHSEGVTDQKEIQNRILATRDAHLDGKD